MCVFVERKTKQNIKSMILFAYSLYLVCWFSFLFLIGQPLSLKLVSYKEARNNQGLKEFKIQSKIFQNIYLKGNVQTSSEDTFVNYITLYIINSMDIKYIK